MTFDTEIDAAFHESYRAALVITGSVEAAARALDDAVTALETDVSPPALLMETIRCTLQQSANSKELTAVLPRELQALSRLPPIGRCCFVLRFAIGLDLQTCSEILGLHPSEIEEALCQAVVELSRRYRLARKEENSNSVLIA